MRCSVIVKIVPTVLCFSLWMSVAPGADDYAPGPDAQPKQGVPTGRIEQGTYQSTGIFKGTTRSYSVYIPAQYDGTNSAALMVFQDGGGFVKKDGHTRVPIVFDNLIAAKEMPVTIGVFIEPGTLPPEKPGGMPRKNRSLEYDTLSDDYARFLIDDFLPYVSRNHAVTFTTDPNCRAICGNSSGGICAFTVAWERPDSFRKVVSHIGSFTNIRGGDVYPGLIRKAEKRPIRVFLQDGENDLDNAHGNWPLANKQMEKALAYAKYDYKMVWGDGAHNAKHGGAIFPDTMRWLWRDWKETCGGK